MKVVMLDNLKESPEHVGNWFSRARRFLGDVRSELGRVTWPTRREVWATTIVVILTSLLRINAGYMYYTSNQGKQNADGSWPLSDRTDHAFTVSVKVAPTRTNDVEIGFQQLRSINGATTSAGYNLRPFQDDPRS